MHHALGMRRLQRVGDLQRPIEQRSQRHWSVADALAEGLPFQQLHRNKGMPLVLVDLVDCADIRMVEGRGRPRLALEPL